jgi:hypothetical protein
VLLFVYRDKEKLSVSLCCVFVHAVLADVEGIE